ncbi:MAG: XdhC family protein [Thiolinea sp.]
MLNQNQDILTRALSWLNEGYAVVLYTVVNTWGSSPRPPGSIMALRADGHVAGSVSGGCIEDDLIRRLEDEGVPDKPGLVSYGVEADEARRFGLPCGGTMRLVQEPLDGVEASVDLNKLLGMLEEGEIVSRELDFATGTVSLSIAQDNAVLSCDEERFVSVFGPRYRLLIIGAGQIGELLAQIALSLDFAVTICDPRTEYNAEWAVAGTTLVTTMPDDTVLEMQMDSRTAVVALTHDPKLDDLALIEALASPAFYVGALGSKSNNDKRRERLQEFVADATKIARLHGPAGLSIGSHTPAEIAVSIAAQMVAAKNDVL